MIYEEVHDTRLYFHFMHFTWRMYKWKRCFHVVEIWQFGNWNKITRDILKISKNLRVSWNREQHTQASRSQDICLKAPVQSQPLLALHFLLHSETFLSQERGMIFLYVTMSLKCHKCSLSPRRILGPHLYDRPRGPSILVSRDISQRTLLYYRESRGIGSLTMQLVVERH
jgi:hypothetical protein